MSHRAFSERFLAATRVGDRAALEAMLDPAFELEEAASLPYAGVYRGVSGWLELTQAVVAAWSKFRLELIEVVAETDESLVLRFAISGRSRLTDKPFESTVLEHWRFRNGKLLHIRPYYFDTHQLVAANAP